MDQNLDGDRFGDFESPQRGQENQFEGFYIDDVMIGFSERGEMVTRSSGVPALNSFFATPTNPDPNAPSEVLVGPYQLEIRRGTEYG